MSERLVAARIAHEEDVPAVMRALADAGVPRRHIEVLSNLPLPESLIGPPMRATHLPYFTAAGLCFGLLLGILLSPGTVFLYPLEVGAQPIFSPPSLVIIYELTMWFIVLFTFAGFVLETRVRTGAPRYPLVPAEHEILVVADVPQDLVPARVAAALTAQGAELIDPHEGRD